jgi:hypothetical protein
MRREKKDKEKKQQQASTRPVAPFPLTISEQDSNPVEAKPAVKAVPTTITLALPALPWILSRVPQASADPTPTATEDNTAARAALTTELSAMEDFFLRNRAKHAGVAPEEISAAREATEPKGALIRLIVDKELPEVKVPEAPPGPSAEQLAQEAAEAAAVADAKEKVKVIEAQWKEFGDVDKIFSKIHQPEGENEPEVRPSCGTPCTHLC